MPRVYRDAPRAAALGLAALIGLAGAAGAAAARSASSDGCAAALPPRLSVQGGRQEARRMPPGFPDLGPPRRIPGSRVPWRLTGPLLPLPATERRLTLRKLRSEGKSEVAVQW